MKRLMPPGMGKKMHAALPLQRFATVEEMGHIAVFLVSNAACYITGTTLVADGASTMPVSGIFWAAMRGL